MVDEIFGSGSRVSALIVEADPVAKAVVAKHDTKLCSGLDTFVRSVHLVGVAHVTAFVSAHEPVGGSARISSSVAIQRLPCSATMGIIAGRRSPPPARCRAVAERGRVVLDGPVRIMAPLRLQDSRR